MTEPRFISGAAKEIDYFRENHFVISTVTLLYVEHIVEKTVAQSVVNNITVFAQ